MSDDCSLIFMFENNQCVYIYAETGGAMSEEMDRAARKIYTNSWNVLTGAGLMRYYLENNPYDGKDHTIQCYQSIRYYIPRDWNNVRD